MLALSRAFKLSSVSLKQTLQIDDWNYAHYLAAAFCACAILIPLGGEILFALIALVGCYRLAVPSHRQNVLNQIGVDKTDWLLMGLAIASIFFLKAISLGWTIAFKASVRDVGTHTHFLLFIPVVAALSSLKQSDQAQLAAKAGCIVAGCIGGVWAVGHELYRWHINSDVLFKAGAQNAIVLGGFACILTIWLFLWFTQQARVWTGLGLLGAVIMMLSTGRRTPVMAIAVVIVVLSLMRWRQMRRIRIDSAGVDTKEQSKTLNRSALWLFGIIGCIVAIAVTASSWQLAATEMQKYLSQRDASTSIGARLELYTVAIKAFKAAPWFGHGAGTTYELVQRFSDQAKNVFWTGHMHNQYFQWLTETGLVGLVFVVMTLHRVWQSLTQRIDAALTWAWPASLLIAIAVWALVSAVFKQGLVNAYFVFMLALLWLWTHPNPAPLGTVTKQSNHHR